MCRQAGEDAAIACFLTIEDCLFSATSPDTIGLESEWTVVRVRVAETQHDAVRVAEKPHEV